MRQKKPQWTPPRENTGSVASGKGNEADRKKFWADGGVIFTTDPRLMKTPHVTRRRKENV